MGTNSWQTLNSLAANGQLVLDPSVRADCAKACDDLIKALNDAQNKLSQINFRFNLGDFTCPAPLIDAIEATAIGDDGFRGRLLQHIAIVQEIKATILHQVQQLQEQDDANAGAVQDAGAQPNIVAPPTQQQADQAAMQAAAAAATSPEAIQAVLNNIGQQIHVPPPVL
jgi:hypothetical protein